MRLPKRLPRSRADVREVLAYALHRLSERISDSVTYEVIRIAHADGTVSAATVRSHWGLGVDTTVNVRLSSGRTSPLGPHEHAREHEHAHWPLLITGLPTAADAERAVFDSSSHSPHSLTLAEAKVDHVWRP